MDGSPRLEKTTKDPDGGPYPVYSSGMSWDEVPGKMNSGKKFFHNAISGADFATQPYHVAIVETLSEQQLVDCDLVDSTCNGVFVDNGFAFGEKNGLCTGASCSDTSTKDTCKDSSYTADIIPRSVTGYKDVFTDIEQALMLAAAQQLVSTSIGADQSSRRSNSSGVLTASCGRKPDHCIFAVAHGTDAGTDYWKVKNSGVRTGQSVEVRWVRTSAAKDAEFEGGVSDSHLYIHLS